MNKLDNTPNPSGDVADALAQMQADQQVASGESIAATTSVGEMNAVQSPPPTPNSTQILKLFKQINQTMAELLQTFVEIDKSFGSMSNIFFEQAAAINIHDNMSKEERNELLVNLGLGAATLALGGVVKSFKITATLTQIKQVLRQEAEKKLPYLIAIQGEMARGLMASWNQLTKWDLNSLQDCKRLEMPFNSYRAALYHYVLGLYLIETYQAAQNGELQNRIKLPTTYDINRLIMCQLLGHSDLRLSDLIRNPGDFNYHVVEQMVRSHNIPTQELGQLLEDMLTGTKGSINKERATPLAAIYITALDPQMMALVVHELNPLPHKVMDADFNDDNELKSSPLYNQIAKIWLSARVSDSTCVGRAVVENKTFEEVAYHCVKMDEIHTEWDRRNMVLMINLVLFGVLGFMLGMYAWDLKWYWCLLTGIGGLLVGYIFSPISKVHQLYTLKLTHWERTVQQNSKRGAGHQCVVQIGEIASNNTLGWVLTIVCGLVGLPAWPVGAIAGVIIGACLAAVLGLWGFNVDDMQEYNYDQIPGVKAWRGWLMMLILLGANVAMFIKL